MPSRLKVGIEQGSNSHRFHVFQMTDTSETRSLALHFSRELAWKLMPLMRELNQKLKDHRCDDEPSASAILLLAAVGFVLTEEGEYGAANRLSELSAEVKADFIPRHIY